MMCPSCQANLGHINRAGEPMVRAKGFVLKAEGVVAICPKCSASVPLEGELAKAFVHRLLLPAKPRPLGFSKKSDVSRRS